MAQWKSMIAGLVVSVVGASPTRVIAQEEIWFLDSPTIGEGLGHTRVGPDLDGDGLPELLISASLGACVQKDDGYVAIVSTRNGELHRWCSSGGGAFGVGIAWVGDIDGGGVVDVAIGEPWYYDPVKWGTDTGRIQVYSTETKQLIYEIIGTQMFGKLGNPIAAMDDVDGDGVRDLLVGVPSHGTNNDGQVRIYSMKTGVVVWKVTGGFQMGLGGVVGAVNDVDGDGVGDCGYASSGGSSGVPAYVAIVSGVDGTERLRVTSTAGGDMTGQSIAAAGDLDGDGLADVVFGGFDPLLNGFVDSYSAVTDTRLWRIPGANQENFGARSCAVGDINQDGFDDFLVTSDRDDHDGRDAGRVDLISGRSHRSLYRFYAGFKAIAHGSVLTRGVDFNGDGFEDLIIGNYNGSWVQSKGGYVGIYAGNDLWLQADPLAPDTASTVTVDLRGGEPNRLGLIALTAINGAPLFAPLLIAPFDANGELQLTTDTDPSVGGLDFEILGFAENRAGRGPLMVSSKQLVEVQ